jgi:hypothetical protein
MTTRTRTKPVKAQRQRVQALFSFKLTDAAILQVDDLLNKLPDEDIRRNLEIGMEYNIGHLAVVQQQLADIRYSRHNDPFYTDAWKHDRLERARHYHQSIAVARVLMEYQA